MRRSRNIIFSIRILWLLGTLAATPAAAATFDGEWNVRIASRNTACTSGATVQIGINNGQVGSANGAMTASGRVAGDGDINVGIGDMARHHVRGHLDRAAHLICIERPHVVRPRALLTIHPATRAG